MEIRGPKFYSQDGLRVPLWLSNHLPRLREAILWRETRAAALTAPHWDGHSSARIAGLSRNWDATNWRTRSGFLAVFLILLLLWSFRDQLVSLKHGDDIWIPALAETTCLDNLDGQFSLWRPDRCSVRIRGQSLWRDFPAGS